MLFKSTLPGGRGHPPRRITVGDFDRMKNAAKKKKKKAAEAPAAEEASSSDEDGAESSSGSEFHPEEEETGSSSEGEEVGGDSQLVDEAVEIRNLEEPAVSSAGPSRGGVEYNSRKATETLKRAKARERQRISRQKKRVKDRLAAKKSLGEKVAGSLKKRQGIQDKKKIARKPRKKQPRNWTYETLVAAVDEYNGSGGTAKIRKLAFKYGVPRSTLHDHVRNKRSLIQGRPTFLSAEDEEKLASIITLFSRNGAPLVAEDLYKIVQRYVKNKRVELAAKGQPLEKTDYPGVVDDKPGEKWMRGFLVRQPEIKAILEKTVPAAKAKLTLKELQTFFTQWDITTTGVPPENIVNADETCIVFAPSKRKVKWFFFF